MKTRKVFCAFEQKETDHDSSLAQNGEIVLTCECGHFIKFPVDADLSKELKAYKKANEL